MAWLNLTWYFKCFFFLFYCTCVCALGVPGVHVELRRQLVGVISLNLVNFQGRTKLPGLVACAFAFKSWTASLAPPWSPFILKKDSSSGWPFSLPSYHSWNRADSSVFQIFSCCFISILYLRFIFILHVWVLRAWIYVHHVNAGLPVGLLEL